MNQNVTKNSPVVCDGFVEYEEAEVHRSAIMRDSRYNEKKWQTGGHFGFYHCEICHGLPLCETLHFVYIQGPAILHFLVRPA